MTGFGRRKRALFLRSISFAEAVAAVRIAEGETRRAINPTVYPWGELRAKLGEGHRFLRTVMAGPKVFIVGDEDELTGLLEKRRDPEA